MDQVKILDACCGSKMFWFDKNEPHTTYMDIREEELMFIDRGNVRHSSVKPDVVADFGDKRGNTRWLVFIKTEEL